MFLSLKRLDFCIFVFFLKLGLERCQSLRMKQDRVNLSVRQFWWIALSLSVFSLSIYHTHSIFYTLLSLSLTHTLLLCLLQHLSYVMYLILFSTQVIITDIQLIIFNSDVSFNNYCFINQDYRVNSMTWFN